MPVSWKTKLIHTGAEVPSGFRSLATPTWRGSTTLFRSAAEVQDNWRHDQAPYTYGLYGTPTTLELAARISELEKGHGTVLTPGGQSAISLIYFAFLGAGEHALVPDSIYGPSRGFADDLLGRYGVEVDYYPPGIGAGIEALVRPNTRLVWCESPGSVTMEVQDVPAIAAVAHRHGAVVALDNTYAAGILFDAFAHGADVSMQALTKYIGGHSDLLLGSVTAAGPAAFEAVGNVHHHLGLAVSPDDCSLALRGLQTLAVRLAEIERTTLAVAGWAAGRPEIRAVLHPALPSCPGHEIWQRDFTGSAGVFSLVFRDDIPADRIVAFVDALELFKIGYSWGGVTSLVLPCFDLVRNDASWGDRLVRLNIGLEASEDLIADLESALSRVA